MIELVYLKKKSNTVFLAVYCTVSSNSLFVKENELVKTKKRINRLTLNFVKSYALIFAYNNSNLINSFYNNV